MADYEAHYEKFRAAGAGLVGISVDDASRTEPLRREMGIEFPILCDARREVVTAYGLLNKRENGGIAFPATFVLDRDRVVRFRVLEETGSRVEVDALLRFVQGLGGAGTAVEPKRRGVWPGAMFLRAAMNALRHGVRVPYK